VSRARIAALPAAIALAGAAGTLVAGLVAGMPGAELEHLALLLLPAAGVTAACAAVAARVLARSSLRGRLLAVAALATAVGLANLGVLAGLMFVSGHDAAQLAILLVYSSAAGIGAAVVIARASAGAVERLERTAQRLAAGELSARVGRLGAGPELDALAAALDEMAARLERSLERERALESQRWDLITAVSHDLRTPLASLRAMVEAVDDGVVDDPATIRRYLGEMRGAVDSLVLLVDDLFELVQLDSGAIQAETERARLEDVVHSALSACDAQALEKRLELRLRLNELGQLPCSPRLTRVVQNLVQNAIRHTPTDGTVVIEAQNRGRLIELAVADDGEGIAPESLDRIFEPFWRGDEARSGAGSGLGLALSKRIIEALGGEIRVESEPARGSRFAVLLPAAG
jgi:signal transduction histidine kinase